MRRDFNRTNLRLPLQVWDLPIRLFHWAIVLLVAFSYATATLHHYDLHILSGETILALLLFRIVWGFVGSETARFHHFLRSPLLGLKHLMQFGRRDPDDVVGHNEAGGWMVLVMLLLLAAQVGTGLFSNHDGMQQGPLAAYAGMDGSDQVTHWHLLIWNFVLAAIALHVLAIIAYAAIKRQNLIRPMFTGKKRLPAATRAPRIASPLLALVILACAAVAAWAIATQT